MPKITCHFIILIILFIERILKLIDKNKFLLFKSPDCLNPIHSLRQNKSIRRFIALRANYGK